MTRLLGLVAAVALASGCAAAGGPPATSDTPRRDLAVRPSPLPATPGGGGSAPTTPAGDHSATPRPGGTAPAGSAPAGSTGPGSTSGGGNSTDPEAPYRTFVTMPDGASDAGLGAPAYADLRSVTLADNGASLRVTVEMNGALPHATATGESMGIGVDLYRAATKRESDYQLFADGEPDGWFAYLDTPKGFVRYPGTFALGGRTMVFTVPWSSVGNPRTGRTSAFADWTQRSSAATGNPSSNDYVPTLGTTNYSR
ncbi:MAG: hypothetical protein QOC82_2563 [Frankiaceae bacterium]|jgi:hypothetical protein|nr:hypothetical protein [Frankiaceae bacterium]